MTLHFLDRAICLESLGGDCFGGRTSPEYANMVCPFGGVTAACLLQAPIQHAARIGEPIALTVNFAAGLDDGEFEIVACALRTNRSTQHWAMELSQDGVVATCAGTVFALRRHTWLSTKAAFPEGLARPETLRRSAALDDLAWTRCHDLRFVRGALPAAASSHQIVYFRE